MAGSPQYKVYSPSGEYVAACKEIEHAAAIIGAFYAYPEEPGATIRYGHSKKWTLFTQGIDGDAGESYDMVAIVSHARRQKLYEDSVIARLLH